MQLSIKCPFCNLPCSTSPAGYGCHNSRQCGRFGMDVSPEQKILSIRWMIETLDDLPCNILFSNKILFYNGLKYKFKYPAPKFTSPDIKKFIQFCQTKIQTLNNFQ